MSVDSQPSDSWVAYVGPFRFPWGDASSRRVWGIAQSLALGGRRVVVLSGEPGPSAPQEIPGVDGPGSIHHVGVGELPQAGDSLLAKSLQWLMRAGQRTAAWLDTQRVRPSHVIVYGGGMQYMFQLQRWCRRNGVPILADVVEWYSPKQLRGGRLGPLHLSTKVALRYHYPRCAGVVAISSFLESYYRERGCAVVRVPPTLDVRALGAAPVAASAGGMRLVYAGSPGRKDLLAETIRGVDLAARDGCDVSLQVIGPSPAEVTRALGAPPPPPVRVRGRVPQQEVPALLRQADFSILMREPARFAQAGFPTKFCESLAHGTPVIANLTSDLRSYLRDGVEGLVLPDHSAQSLRLALHRALHLPAEVRGAMRRAAHERAVASFDVRGYVAVLDELLTVLQARPVRTPSTTGRNGDG
ncbi:glycosyltransferase [Micromonospora yasonensis]|uniref:glycosyltransferase n=1 Tax=Micromonospora yasonensis TaxID=1128667 RepID=UPI00222E7117|nr:glycosyltransferase [Micromonospora yasonensis]MCW3839602.1 glycosyltransferase [Micromonospora yasonensis]